MLTGENMTDKTKQVNTESVITVKQKKTSPEELQQWLDAVHFGSCCSDPLISDDQQKHNGDDNIEKSG